MVIRQWLRIIFNAYWGKIYFCWKICKDLKEQNLEIYDFNIKKNMYIDKLDDIVYEWVQ